MKIIAKTGSAFLVEITEAEIAACCGYQHTYTDDWKSFLRSHGKQRTYNGSYGLEVGCEFHPKAISDWHHNMAYKMKQVVESAGFLKSLAEMMEHPPKAFTIPPTEAEKRAVIDAAKEDTCAAN